MNLLVWSMRKLIGPLFSLVGVFVLLFSSKAFSISTSENDADEYFDFLARVNRFSPLEHAGSHGTLGIGLGIGVAGYAAPSNQNIRKQYWRGEGQSLSDSETNTGQVIINRIQLHKGLPLSVDVGGAFGQDSSTKAQIISGYAQWTMYEGFAMPAFALRGSFSRLSNLAATEASNITAEGLASYGFLRVFTVYGAAGIGFNQATVKSSPEFGTTFVLAQNGATMIQRQYSQRSQSLGLQIQILPPFCTVAAETNIADSGAKSYLAKLSIGM